MKKVFSYLMLLAVSALLAACNSGSTADNSVSAGPGIYNTPGFMAYPGASYANSYSGYGYGGSSASYGCACPSGYSPVYNPQAQLGCIQSSYLTPIQSLTGFYYLPAGNSYGTQNIPQVSNIPNAGVSGCGGVVAASCVLNQQNSCQIAGYTCRQVTPSSTVGICTH